MHRDVKPQNVLISEEGAAKITDFGIARPLSEDALTLTGRVLATTDYIAPEQALGRPVSGQSDLYSLGIVLYEMLTGEVPFHGDSAVAVAMRHVREALPDVQRLRPGVSAATAAVIDRAATRTPPTATRTLPAWSPTSRQRSRSRPRAPGRPTGEVTSVLRTLPQQTRQRLPLRVRHPGAWAPALAVVLAAAVALVLILALGRHPPRRRHRERPPRAPRPAAGRSQPERCAQLQPVRHRTRRPR